LSKMASADGETVMTANQKLMDGEFLHRKGVAKFGLLDGRLVLMDEAGDREVDFAPGLGFKIKAVLTPFKLEDKDGKTAFGMRDGKAEAMLMVVGDGEKTMPIPIITAKPNVTMSKVVLTKEGNLEFKDAGGKVVHSISLPEADGGHTKKCKKYKIASAVLGVLLVLLLLVMLVKG
jgi:hypothetical protein